MWLYHAIRPLAYAVRPLVPGRLVGSEHLPAHGPVLLAVNHASFLDPWLVGMLLPRAPVRFLINEAWYRRSRVWRSVFDAFGVVPASEAAPEATLERVGEALGRGELVAVFPEGRISADGSLGRAQRGFGWMAARTGAPVVPARLVGSHDVLPRQRRLPRRAPVSLVLGVARRFAEVQVERPDRDQVVRFVDAVWSDVRGLGT